MKKELRILTVNKPDGKWLKPVVRYTKKAVSAYANKMWRKYGEGTVIEEYNTVTEQKTIWG